MHEKLLKIVRTLETDYEPYGKVEQDNSDCSCGCRHFVKLAGDAGEEWGVCANPDSARAGLLTFDTKGAPHSNRSCWIERSRIHNLGLLLQKRVRFLRTVGDNALIQSHQRKLPYRTSGENSCTT